MPRNILVVSDEEYREKLGQEECKDMTAQRIGRKKYHRKSFATEDVFHTDLPGTH